MFHSVLLSKGVERLEVTLKTATAILALAAGVYAYLGVRELQQPSQFAATWSSRPSGKLTINLAKAA